MNGAFYIGATGLRSQQTALDVAANNVANINTPGFKRSQVRFAELMSSGASLDGLSLTRPDAATLMSGVMARTGSKVFTQGDLRQTGQMLDLAIDGDGFIELVDETGETVLWRGGTLKVNAEGLLAAENGMILKSAISVPIDAKSLSIARDGKVVAIAGEPGAAVEIGRIELALAKDASGLEVIGEGLYRAETPGDLLTAAPGEDAAGTLLQGAVEASNVELSEEMVNLLVMQRAYAANAQVLQAGDQLMAIANGLRR